MNFREIGDITEGVRVTEGDVEDTVVGQGGKGGDDSCLLTSTMGSSRDKDTSILSSELTTSPEGTSGIPERLMIDKLG